MVTAGSDVGVVDGGGKGVVPSDEGVDGIWVVGDGGDGSAVVSFDGIEGGTGSGDWLITTEEGSVALGVDDWVVDVEGGDVGGFRVLDDVVTVDVGRTCGVWVGGDVVVVFGQSRAM